MEMDHLHVGEKKKTLKEAMQDASNFVKGLKKRAVKDDQSIANCSHDIVVTGYFWNRRYTATVIAITQHRRVEH